MASTRITVAGWSTCSFFVRTRTALQGLAVLSNALQVEVVEHPDRDTYRSWLKGVTPRFSGIKAQAHTSSPVVWLNENDVR